VTRRLTVRQVCAVLAVSARTVRRWVAAGELAAEGRGRGLRIAEDELARFSRSRQRTGCESVPA